MAMMNDWNIQLNIFKCRLFGVLRRFGACNAKVKSTRSITLCLEELVLNISIDQIIAIKNTKKPTVMNQRIHHNNLPMEGSASKLELSSLVRLAGLSEWNNLDKQLQRCNFNSLGEENAFILLVFCLRFKAPLFIFHRLFTEFPNILTTDSCDRQKVPFLLATEKGAPTQVLILLEAVHQSAIVRKLSTTQDISHSEDCRKTFVAEID